MPGLNSQLLEGVAVMAAVVDARSFGGAGEALDMSQSGVSRSVARLEARLGLRVFERTTRSVRLTEEGRRFYEQVMPLIAALEEATLDASGAGTAIRGRLRVNADPFFARLVLGPRLGDFLARHPDLEMELRTRDDLGDMIAEGFDVALRFGHPRPSSLVARKLLDSRVLTVAAPSYLERHGRPVHPRDLALPQHQCLQFRDSASGRAFAWEFHQRRQKIVVETHGPLLLNDAGVLHSTCLAGHGVAQMFELGAERWLAEGALVNLFPDWCDERFPLHAYYPSRHHVPAKTRALLDFVVDLAVARTPKATRRAIP